MMHTHYTTGQPCNCTFTRHLDDLQENAKHVHDFVLNYKPTFSKTAGLTRGQRLRKQQEWNDALGPDRAPVVRQFPDGWSVRRLMSPHAECYEGEMMPNCLGGADTLMNRLPEHEWHQPTSIGSNPEYTYYSVRDPDNLPHATFAHDPENDKSFWDLGLEGRAGANASKYAPYAHDWWTSIGGRPVKSWDGSQIESEGTTNDLPAVGSPEHLNAPENPGWGEPTRPVAWWERPKDQWGRLAPETIHRAGKPLQKAMTMPDPHAESYLRQRLQNNFKPEHVNYLVDDFNRHRQAIQDYEQKTSPDAIKPYVRKEFPEFYWMHGSYGPQVMEQIKKYQETYKGTYWNHPGVWRSSLVNDLIQHADQDPTQAEDIANRWVNGHLVSQGQEPDVPRVERLQPGIQNFLDQAGPEDWRQNPETMQKLRENFTEHVPDPDFDQSQAWSIPPRYIRSKTATLMQNCPNCNDGGWGWGDPSTVPGECETCGGTRQVPVTDFYHSAPTSERRRILQHGLQPSKPSWSTNWSFGTDPMVTNLPNAGLMDQPPGVYVTTDPDTTLKREFFDKWRIDPSYIKELQDDRQWYGAKVVPHAIPPEALTLHKSAEPEIWDLHRQAEPWTEEPMPLPPDYRKQLGLGLPTRIWGRHE